MTENNKQRQYVPAVGANVRLRTWSDYATRGLVDHVWSYFRVISVHPDSVVAACRTATLQRVNGSCDEGDPITVVLAAIEPPIGWQPSYTIYCEPAKVAQVLSWFSRGIRVKVDHALDRLAGNCYMPLDNGDQAPTWGYATADDVPPADCPKVFSIVAYVEQAFRIPKDPWVRRHYKRACAAKGWKLHSINYGANGHAWYRSKEVIAYSPDGDCAYFDTDDATFTPPETALDVLSRLADTPRTSCAHHQSQYQCGAAEVLAPDCTACQEQDAIANGRPIPRWILNRAEYHLRGTLQSAGNSTWMYDPEAAGDPVCRT